MQHADNQVQVYKPLTSPRHATKNIATHPLHDTSTHPLHDTATRSFNTPLESLRILCKSLPHAGNQVQVCWNQKRTHEIKLTCHNEELRRERTHWHDISCSKLLINCVDLYYEDMSYVQGERFVCIYIRTQTERYVCVYIYKTDL